MQTLEIKRKSACAEGLDERGAVALVKRRAVLGKSAVKAKGDVSIIINFLIKIIFLINIAQNVGKVKTNSKSRAVRTLLLYVFILR